MCRKCSTLLFLLFPLLLLAQGNFNAPPGTVKFSNDLYIDKVPVTNQMYLEFLGSLESFWSAEMHQQIQRLPKYGVNPNYREMNQKEKNAQEISSVNFSVGGNSDYLRHPRFRQNPVLQISKREAELFCRWRTDMVMLLWSIRAATPEERKQFPSHIKYRLPTDDEYKQVTEHFKNSGSFQKTQEESPLELASANPSDELIFHNISEFTFEGDLFGSNWRGSEPTAFPNDATGFRCICEVEFSENK